MYKHSDFEKIGFSFSYEGRQYKTIDFPTNNGNFTAADDDGRKEYFNILDVIENSKYIYAGKYDDGRKRCRKCGNAIVNGVNGYMLSEVCTDCNGIPQYSEPCKQMIIDDDLYIDYLESCCIGRFDD